MYFFMVSSSKPTVLTQYPRKGLKHWFEYYNQERFHQSLGDLTPDEVYFKEHKWQKAA
jgi:transposase InsO family protein